MIDLTIVIPSYETRSLLIACLESVEAARRAHPQLSIETILVDNGSRDGSVEEIGARFPDLRLIACVRNRGFAAAVNLGLRIRRGRMVLLLNSDVRIEADLLVAGVRILERHPEIGVLGASLAHSDGRPQRSVHRLPSLWTELLPDFALDRTSCGAGRGTGVGVDSPAGVGAEDSGLQTVEAVRGAVFFVRGKLLEELGLLDESFFFFLEETEFCDRVAQAGHRVVRAESLRAVHHLGASSKRRAALATRIEFHRSLYRYFEKRHGRGMAGFVRVLRTLRGALMVLSLATLSGLSSRQRRRLPERWGLLLWHLRGCPDEPRLDDALEAAGIEPGVAGSRRRMRSNAWMSGVTHDDPR